MKCLQYFVQIFCLFSLLAPFVHGDEEVKKDDRLFHLPADQKAAYYLLTPPEYDSSQRYPLIVSLHGAGEKGDRMVRYWKEAAAKFGCVLCCPNSEGFSWNREDMKRILLIVQTVEKDYSIDPKRVLLNGISAGGAVTYILGLSVQVLFPYLNPMSAGFNKGYDTLLQRAKPVPIFITHGTKDDVIPAAQGRFAEELFRKFQFKVTYIEKPEDGHNLPEGEQPTILQWFKNQWNEEKAEE